MGDGEVAELLAENERLKGMVVELRALQRLAEPFLPAGFFSDPETIRVARGGSTPDHDCRTRSMSDDGGKTWRCYVCGRPE